MKEGEKRQANSPTAEKKEKKGEAKRDMKILRVSRRKATPSFLGGLQSIFSTHTSCIAGRREKKETGPSMKQTCRR